MMIRRAMDLSLLNPLEGLLAIQDEKGRTNTFTINNELSELIPSYPELLSICVYSFKCCSGSNPIFNTTQFKSRPILYYCTSGMGLITIAKEQVHIGSGDLVIIPAGIPYSVSTDETDPCVLCEFEFFGSASGRTTQLFISRNQSSKGFLSYNLERMQLFDGLFKIMLSDNAIEILFHVTTCLQYLLSSSVISSAHLHPLDKSQERVNSAIRYLTENYNKQLSVSEIACKVNMSASHFSHIFKQKTGLTPIDYFNQIKVRKACDLLQNSNMLIKEIAFKLGIEDSNYFTKVFTKIMGVRPNEYRSPKYAA